MSLQDSPFVLSKIQKIYFPAPPLPLMMFPSFQVFGTFENSPPPTPDNVCCLPFSPYVPLVYLLRFPKFLETFFLSLECPVLKFFDGMIDFLPLPAVSHRRMKFDSSEMESPSPPFVKLFLGFLLYHTQFPEEDLPFESPSHIF